MNLSPGKLERMKRLARPGGVIAALAMDQRGSLEKMLAQAKGCDRKDITPQMMAEFKAAVTKHLSPHASAILLDPEFGLGAAAARGSRTGLLLAYEKSGYDNERPGRLPDLLDNVSVKRIAEDFQADAVKVLLHYTPFEEARLDGIPINEVKHAIVERVGAECETYQIPFFLEFVGYDPAGGDEKGFDYARIKPEVVTRSMAEFSQPQYKVDVLKVEIPVNLQFVEGSGVYQGRKAYSRQEALEHFRRSAAAATKPFIYLSAGVSNRQFVESLAMAAEAGADFSGVLCGRATWQDGVPRYAAGGLPALEEWLASGGVNGINAVNAALGPARPWYAKLGLEPPVA
jgi:tagatose 1,6-diphosphate aldolase